MSSFKHSPIIDGAIGQKIRYEAYDLTTGERIYSYDKLKEDILKFRSSSKFTKYFGSQVPEFSVDVFYKIFVKLMPYLEKHTNRLIHASRDAISREPLTREDIMSISNVSASTLSRFIKECRDKQYCVEILKQGDVKEIYFNPVYVLNGRYITVELYLLFKGSSIERFITDGHKKLIEHYLSGGEEQSMDTEK